MTQIPWPLDNILIRKVEAWGKKGARAIKRGRIKFLNRKGEKFDWDNDDLTDLEVVDEQPKLIDPGVADIPVPDEYDEEITESDEKERPSYVTRAVLARQRAGLNRESEPGAARGVGVLRADDVIVIDDDDDTIQGDYQSAFAPPLTIKVEEANIPVDSEVEQ